MHNHRLVIICRFCIIIEERCHRIFQLVITLALKMNKCIYIFSLNVLLLLLKGIWECFSLRGKVVAHIMHSDILHCQDCIHWLSHNIQLLQASHHLVYECVQVY